MNKEAKPYHSIVVFDGVCNFCNASVNFIISRDHKDIFKFTPMQSVTGQKLLTNHNISSENTDTFLLIKNDKAFVKSDAALAIAKELEKPWSYLVILRFIPRSVRDFLYSLLARNRYKWFGMREQCMIPTQEIKNKFLT